MGVWSEKYRPKTFDDLVGQKHITDKLKGFLKNKSMPHLLFAGPPGTGKTTSALIIAQYYFKDNWNSNFLELNASDERGIDTIRVKVKDFARTKAMGDVPFKVILLDEADALTKYAQQALRRTMEKYTNTCRFILDCNYSSKIIEPIQSRCAVFRFKPVTKDEMVKYLGKIAACEKLNAKPEIIEAVFTVSEGDCRKAVNVFQSAATLSKELSIDSVYEIASFAKPKELFQVMAYCRDGTFIQARNLLLDIMLQYGLSGIDIVKQLQSQVFNLKLDDMKKAMIIDRIGEAEYRILEGSDPYIQLQSLLAAIIVIIKR